MNFGVWTDLPHIVTSVGGLCVTDRQNGDCCDGLEMSIVYRWAGRLLSTVFNPVISVQVSSQLQVNSECSGEGRQWKVGCIFAGVHYASQEAV